jgi:hypothetical protein
MRIGLIGASGSQLARELCGVFATGKLMQNPCPIVFGIGVVRGRFRTVIARDGRSASAARMSNRRSSEFQVESPGYSTVTGKVGSYLQLRNPGKRRTRFAVRAGGIAAKGNGKQFQGAFLLFESETFHSPENLVFAEGCREDDIRRWNRIGRPERKEAGLSIGIQIQIEMAY